MKELILEQPQKIHMQSAVEFRNKFIKNRERFIPGSAGLDSITGYQAWLKKVKEDLDSRICETYFAVRPQDNKIIGMIEIRLKVTDENVFEIRDIYDNSHITLGGHIQLSIAPDERYFGYASYLLQVGVEHCRTLEIEPIRLVCEAGNVSIIHAIEKLGGTPINEVFSAYGGEKLNIFEL